MLGSGSLGSTWNSFVMFLKRNTKLGMDIPVSIAQINPIVMRILSDHSVYMKSSPIVDYFAGSGFFDSSFENKAFFAQEKS